MGGGAGGEAFSIRREIFILHTALRSSASGHESLKPALRFDQAHHVVHRIN
jgi:hypothetical protein